MLEKISEYNMINMWVTLVLLVILPIILVIVLRKKKILKFKPFLIGCAGFIILVRVLEMIPHTFCIILDNPVSRFIKESPLMYCLYGIMMAGIFEECGRYIIFRYIMKKSNSNKDAISYGVGHGGIEVYVISVTVVATYLYLALNINALGLETFMSQLGVLEAQRDAFLTQISGIYNFGVLMATCFVIERICAVLLHIYMSVLVFKGAKERKIKYMIIAVFTHAFFDIPAALYQYGTLNLVTCEIVLIITTVTMMIIMHKCRLLDVDKEYNIEEK